MKSHRYLGATLGLGMVAGIAHAQSNFAFQGFYAGNEGAFTSISGNGSSNSSSNPFAASQSFTGKDSHGVTQTMTASGSAWSNVQYGKIHIAGQGSVSNPYYNATNSAYYNGTLDPNGSPDLIAFNGNAGFTDIFTYGVPSGVSGTGYLVNFYFRLEGSTSGDTLAGLNFSTSDPQGQSYNPRTKNGNELWITPYYHMEWNQALTVNADFFAGFNTQVSSHAEGVSYSGSAQYGNTLELAGMSVMDSNGNAVSGFTLSAASGTQYNTTPVPEPTTVSAFLFGAVAFLRARRKSRTSR